MRECRTYGSARGVGGNAHPYRDISGPTDHEWISIPLGYLRPADRSLGAKQCFRILSANSTARKLGTRAPMAIPQDRNLRWSLDFVADALVSGRRFRILTLVDDFTRECLGLVGHVAHRPACRPRTRSDRRTAQLSLHDRQRQRHRTDLERHLGLATGAWRRVALHRTRQTDANGFVESFNGRLRDECLNEHLFTNLKEARQIIEEWRIDYNRASQHPSVYVIEEKRVC